MGILPYPPAPEPGWYAEDNAMPATTTQASSSQDGRSPAIQGTTHEPSAEPSPEPSAGGQTVDERDHEPGLLSTDLQVDTPSFVGAGVWGQPLGAGDPTDATHDSNAAGVGDEPQPSTADSLPESTHAERRQSARTTRGGIEDWDSTVLSSSFTAKAPRRSWTLHNKITGQTIVIDKSTLLGRKPSMDVPEGAKSERVIDPTHTTSRNHAAISIDRDGHLWIEDYGSLNGTFIIRDDQETQIKDKPFPLEPPATLRIGDQFFQLTERKG